MRSENGRHVDHNASNGAKLERRFQSRSSRFDLNTDH